MNKNKTVKKPEESTFECFERQVIMHCTYKNTSGRPEHIGLREEIMLLCPMTNHTSHLAYVEGINRRPSKKYMQPGESLKFILLFEGLPKDCLYFNLMEPQIPGFIPFSINNIPRDPRDVYHVAF